MKAGEEVWGGPKMETIESLGVFDLFRPFFFVGRFEGQFFLKNKEGGGVGGVAG